MTDSKVQEDKPPAGPKNWAITKPWPLKSIASDRES